MGILAWLCITVLFVWFFLIPALALLIAVHVLVEQECGRGDACFGIDN